jgi:hypothetical protein
MLSVWLDWQFFTHQYSLETLSADSHPYMTRFGSCTFRDGLPDDVPSESDGGAEPPPPTPSRLIASLQHATFQVKRDSDSSLAAITKPPVTPRRIRTQLLKNSPEMSVNSLQPELSPSGIARRPQEEDGPEVRSFLALWPLRRDTFRRFDKCLNIPSRRSKPFHSLALYKAEPIKSTLQREEMLPWTYLKVYRSH